MVLHSQHEHDSRNVVVLDSNHHNTSQASSSITGFASHTNEQYMNK